MIRDKKIFFLGLFLFILPFLGLPLWWKFAFVIFVALVYMGFSIDFSRFDMSKLPHLPGQVAQQSGQVRHDLPVRDLPVQNIASQREEAIPYSLPPQISVPPLVPKRPARPRKKKIDSVATDIHSDIYF